MMEEKLSSISKNKPKVIIAFPGFGMAASIAAQYFVEHAECENIGRISLNSSELSFMAIHDHKPVWPISVYYSKKYNLLLVHGLAMPKSVENELLEGIRDIVDRSASESITVLESIGSMEEGKHNVYYYTGSDDLTRNMEDKNYNKLKEGIIMGLFPKLYSEYPDKTVGLFSEANINIPDSEAAAKLLKALDEVYGFDIDYGKLSKASQLFEKKLKGIMKKSQEAKNMQDKKQAFYIG